MGIGVGAAVLGAGVLGAAGSAISGSEQAGAANNATAAQLKMYNQTRSDLMPYQQMGGQAFSQVGQLLGLNGSDSSSMLATLRNSPGYQFALNQGQTGLDRTAAARGLLLSGGQLKDTVNYNQGMADQLYGTYYNQLMGASQLGENAAAATGTAGTAAGQGMAQSMMGAGQAIGGAITGGVNNIGGALTTLYGPGGTLSNAPGSAYATGSEDWANTGALAMSDRRLKTDIHRVGEADSGLPIYMYRFKGSKIPQMGVMAQDVEEVAPDAVRTDPRGFKMVDYGRVAHLPNRSKIPLRRAA